MHAEEGCADLRTARLALLSEESHPPTSHPLPGPGTWAPHWTIGTHDRSACQLPPTCLPPSLINSAAATLSPFAKIRSCHPGMCQAPWSGGEAGSPSQHHPSLEPPPCTLPRSSGSPRSCRLAERQSLRSGICTLVKRSGSSQERAGRHRDVSTLGRPILGRPGLGPGEGLGQRARRRCGGSSPGNV